MSSRRAPSASAAPPPSCGPTTRSGTSSWPSKTMAARKRKMHLAQFLCHGPTYHSLAMWRHPRTAAASYDWARPELYQHIAQVCERGAFEMVFFADLNYVSDNYRSTMDTAICQASQQPEHDHIQMLSHIEASP